MPFSTGKSSASMEEVRSCTSRLMLHLGAGCTAPPPTPVRRPGPSPAADVFSSLSDHHLLDHSDEADTSWLSTLMPGSGPSFCMAADFVDDDDDEDDDDGAASSTLGSMCRDSTPPSRAELDELALYLMQQSLCSTPTLLASPSLRRKQGISPCSVDPGAVTNEGATDQSSGGDNQETQHTIFMSGGGLSTFRYSMEGFCEESKMSIRRACEEEGAFYILMTDIGKASVGQAEHLFKRCPSSVDRMCLIASCPLVPLSELLTTKHDHESSTISWEEDEATTDANFREELTMYANLLVKISKELIILLEDICSETWTNLRGCSLKLLLYMYEYGDQEARVSRRDEDLLLSIISHGKANKEGESLLVILGGHIQTWSKGNFKAPSLFPLCNLVDREVCMQLDLVYYR